MEIVNIEADTFREMITSIRLLKEKLENLKGRQTSKSLDDWMDNQEVCMALNISQRTLQALRSNGTLPFSQIDRKTYYRRQDVIRLIEKERKDNPDKSGTNSYKQTTLPYVKGYTSLCVVKYSLSVYPKTRATSCMSFMILLSNTRA